MIKELLLAILLGGLLGFSVTGGYIALSKSRASLPTNAVDNQTVIPTPSVNDSDTSSNTSGSDTIVSTTENHKITVTTPVTESVVTTDKIDITGTTTPNCLVIATTPDSTLNTTSDAEGNFQFRAFGLEAGLNLIQVSAISADDQQADVEIQVTLSSAKF